MKHRRPKDYKKCKKLLYDLYCPSTEANNADYVCPCVHIYSARKYVQWKNCCLYHLKATQHHAYKETDTISIENDMHEDEEETLDIVDGPCLVPEIEKYLEQPFEIIYE